MVQKYLIVKKDRRRITSPTTKKTVTVYRIVVANDIYTPSGALYLQKGKKGGYVQSYDNLSQDGLCFVFNHSVAMEGAVISEDASLYNSIACGRAKVHGNASVLGDCIVSDDAVVEGYTVVLQDVNGNTHLATPKPTSQKPMTPEERDFLISWASEIPYSEDEA